MQDEAQLVDQVRDIMASTFGMDASELGDDVSQENCERWSSLYHMMLLVTLEEHFGVSFSMDEMTSMTSLPKIVQRLNQRGALIAP